jgi:hypothetical protein
VTIASFVQLNQLNHTYLSNCLSLCLTVLATGFYRFRQGSGFAQAAGQNRERALIDEIRAYPAAAVSPVIAKACSGEVESFLISAHPRESGDPGSRAPALVALDSRVRGNERSMV